MLNPRTILTAQFPFLQSESLDRLLTNSRVLELDHKSSISPEGGKIKSLHYIVEGMVRGFYTDDEGVQRTIILRPTKSFSGAPEFLVGGTTSKYGFETVQKTTLIEFPKENITELSKEDLGICRLYNDILRESLATVFFRVELLAGMSPEERYDALLAQQPELFQKSYHKYVANYLGITPNSLSRIIKRKKENR